MLGNPVVIGARPHEYYPHVMIARFGDVIQIEYKWREKGGQLGYIFDQNFFRDSIFQGRWDWVFSTQEISAFEGFFACRMSLTTADAMEKKRMGLESSNGLIDVFKRFSSELQKWSIDTETHLKVGLDAYVKILRQVAPDSDFDPLTNWTHETRFRFLGKLFVIKLNPDKD